MIININPAMEDFEESIRVLNYSAVAREARPVFSNLSQINNEYRTIKRNLSL